jgi:SH3-like domain-containing protein
VERYHPLSIVEKKGNWYRFQDFENDEGWIHNSLLEDIPAVITTRDRCNVRSGPGLKNGILFSVGKGIPFKVLEKKGNWLHVEHSDGDRGWMHRSLTW